MPTQVQWRGGDTSQNNNFTGAEREISVNEDTHSLRVHDAVSAATGNYCGGPVEKPFIETQEIYYIKSIDESKYQVPEDIGVLFKTES